MLVLVSGLAFVALRKRSRGLAVAGLLVGVTLVLFLAGITPDLTAARVTMELKLRVVTGLLSFLMLVVALEAVRRTQMHERYALLWVGTGLVILTDTSLRVAAGRTVDGVRPVTCSPASGSPFAVITTTVNFLICGMPVYVPRRSPMISTCRRSSQCIGITSKAPHS